MKPTIYYLQLFYFCRRKVSEGPRLDTLSGQKLFQRLLKILGLRVSFVIPFPGKESSLLSESRSPHAQSRHSRPSRERHTNADMLMSNVLVLATYGLQQPACSSFVVTVFGISGKLRRGRRDLGSTMINSRCFKKSTCFCCLRCGRCDLLMLKKYIWSMRSILSPVSCPAIFTLKIALMQ